MRVVTIDGPAGAGKSTVARRLADRLGWRLLDTGAMYRAVDPRRAPRRGRPRQRRGPRRPRRAARRPRSRRAGSCSTARTSPTAIRGVEVTRATRHVGRQPERPPPARRLAARVRRPRATSSPRAATRGPIVFPDAFRKFFLTASDEERARRRHAEFAARGELDHRSRPSSRDLRDRDAQDAARAIAPMKPAADARIIDSTGLDLDEVVDLIERRRPPPASTRRPAEVGPPAMPDDDRRRDADAAPRPPDGRRRRPGPIARPAGSGTGWSSGSSARSWPRPAASGPPAGRTSRTAAALLVSNHLSHLDVLVLGILLARPLNYVARSTLFFCPLGPFIRSVGGFPIQREGIGAQGLKETLRRLRRAGS